LLFINNVKYSIPVEGIRVSEYRNVKLGLWDKIGKGKILFNRIINLKRKNWLTNFDLQI